MFNHISVMNYVESQMLVVKSKLNRYMLQTFEFFFSVHQQQFSKSNFSVCSKYLCKDVLVPIILNGCFDFATKNKIIQ